MRVRRVVAISAAVAVVMALFTAVSSAAAPPGRQSQWIHNVTKRIVHPFSGRARVSPNEAGVERSRGLGLINRSLSRRPTASRSLAGVPRVRPNLRVRSGVNGTQLLTFEGLNHHDSRNANGGNQFSLEPPDQGLCVGAGRVVEVVNAAIRIFDKTGVPQTGVVDLNSFYGYPPAINRSTGEFGPFVFDPSCYYDPEHGKFFVVSATLETDVDSGAFTGASHLDIGVGTASDPLGTWNVYSIPGEDDGTHGTPNHHCAPGPGGITPCFPDFPHVGADRYGFFITTNEYDFFGPNFHTAQIYAMSKAKLAAGASPLKVVHLDNLFLGSQPGFTVWPAQSNAGRYARSSTGPSTS